MSPTLYLTPISVVYFCQIILTSLIAGYLLWRASHVTPKWRQVVLAAALFLATTTVLAVMWLESAATGALQLYTRMFIVTVLNFNGFFVFLFLYHIPDWIPRQKREFQIVMLMMAIRFLLEIELTYRRVTTLAATGIFIERVNPLVDAMITLGAFWMLVVSIRRMRRMQRRRGYFTGELILICALLITWALLLAAFASNASFVNIQQINNAFSSMLIVPLMVLLVFDLLPESISLMARLVGVMLIAMLVTVSGLSWLLAPTYIRSMLHLTGSQTPITLLYSLELLGSMQQMVQSNSVDGAFTF